MKVTLLVSKARLEIRPAFQIVATMLGLALPLKAGRVARLTILRERPLAKQRLSFAASRQGYISGRRGA